MAKRKEIIYYNIESATIIISYDNNESISDNISKGGNESMKLIYFT